MAAEAPSLPDLPEPGRPGDLHLRPAAFLTGGAARAAVAAGGALRLAGGPVAFAMVEVLVRGETQVARAWARPDDIRGWAAARGLAARAEALLDALSAPREGFAGFAPGRPLVMGVVNVTPDSFSDGGDFLDPAAAVAHGRELLAAGADILDVGGESTRPGAAPVSPEEEEARVVPVVRGLAEAGAVVSVDTRHARVMRAALAAGARIVNDVSALEGDPGSLSAVAAAGCPVVLMHMRGEPRTMQEDPRYLDAALDVADYLEGRVSACLAAGIPRSRIAVDPGIGFGKTVEHNLHLLRHTGLFHALGCPLLVGVSRKRFIAALSRGEPPKERVAGSLAAGLAALDQGAQILRVHDVAETAQARALWLALNG
ncbi:MAG TPA: dihydropteroate synthase [Azospirillaceae bacterium]|nr:dihydropteroate synthase [Azospirillaceae bacterium]